MRGRPRDASRAGLVGIGTGGVLAAAWEPEGGRVYKDAGGDGSIEWIDGGGRARVGSSPPAAVPLPALPLLYITPCAATSRASRSGPVQIPTRAPCVPDQMPYRSLAPSLEDVGLGFAFGAASRTSR